MPTPSGGGKEATLSDSAGDKGAARAGLIGINNLVYRLEPDMSVAVNCTDKNHFFQQQKYTNSQRAVCVLNSGADYIDPRRSFLCFTIKLPDSVRNPASTTQSGYGTLGPNPIHTKAQLAYEERITFGKPKDGNNRYWGGSAEEFYGSALNLIHSITISTRSGDELSRIERLNLLQYIINPWTRDKLWNETVGAAMGQNQFFTLSPLIATNNNRKATSMRVAIPLYCLSGLFNYDKLLPAMLMSGLRIEIAWAAPQTAFVRSPLLSGQLSYDTWDSNDDADQKKKCLVNYDQVGVVYEMQNKAGNQIPVYPHDAAKSTTADAALTIDSYEICDPYFQLKSVQLTDSVQRILNETSAVNGLEIVYTDINNTQIVNQPSQSTGRCTGDFYMEVRHAASRALRAILVPRIQAADTTQICDSFATIGCPFKRWHWRLGSLYFPHQPIKGNDVLEILPQTYTYTADAWGKIAGAPRCEVTLDEYTSYHQKSYKNPRVVYSSKTQLLDALPNGEELVVDANGVVVKLQYDKYTCCAPIAVSLERSTLFNLSGIPINNSRVLSFHGEYDSATGNDYPNFPTYGPLIFDCFLQYVRLARVFLNNVEVEQ